MGPWAKFQRMKEKIAKLKWNNPRLRICCSMQKSCATASYHLCWHNELIANVASLHSFHGFVYSSTLLTPKGHPDPSISKRPFLPVCPPPTFGLSKSTPTLHLHHHHDCISSSSLSPSLWLIVYPPLSTTYLYRSRKNPSLEYVFLVIS